MTEDKLDTTYTDSQREEIQASLQRRGICVVIPTYNNAATVSVVVTGALRFCRCVIVVDDGSTDSTAEVLARICAVTVVRHTHNKGKGTALRSGFRRAMELGYTYAITLDADGQHFPSDIPLFLEANRRHPASIIVGERDMEGAVRSRGSRFANAFSNFWFCLHTGCRLADTQTGFRLYPLRHLVGLRFLTSRYEAELELMVWASWHGVRIVSVPIRVYYPPREERVSHFRPGPDFARISLLNTFLTLGALVYGWPLRLLRWLLMVGRTAYSLLFFLFTSLCVFMPWVWLVLHTGKMTEGKRCHLRHIIHRYARFVMVRHGIPGVRFKCNVAEWTDFSRPHLIICNHQSHLDLMCQLIFTDKVVFLTNDWVWNSPFFGLLIRNAEYLPVSRGMEEIMPRLRSLVQRGYSVAVYPEGTRSVDCRVHRFHKGAFLLARELGLDILPMCLYGTGKVLPKKCRHLNPGVIAIEVGKPVPLDALGKAGILRSQTSEMHRRYVEKYAEMCDNEEKYL